MTWKIVLEARTVKELRDILGAIFDQDAVEYLVDVYKEEEEE